MPRRNDRARRELRRAMATAPAQPSSMSQQSDVENDVLAEAAEIIDTEARLIRAEKADEAERKEVQDKQKHVCPDDLRGTCTLKGNVCYAINQNMPRHMLEGQRLPNS